MLKGSLVLALLLGPNLAGAQELPEEQLVDPETFFNFIIPAAKKDFEAYHGDMVMSASDKRTPTYEGLLLLDDADSCLLKFEPKQPVSYSCFKVHIGEAQEPEGSPCLAVFKGWAAGLRRSLRSGWTLKEGSDKGAGIHSLSARRKSDDGVYLQLTHTPGSAPDEGNCSVDVKIQHRVKKKSRK